MGFFFKEKKKTKAKAKSSPKRINDRQSVEALHRMECEACPLNHVDYCDHPKMPPRGKAKRPVAYMLGEAPGEKEDEVGKQFVGISGRYLRETIPRTVKKTKLRWNNVVRTRPRGNRAPTQVEMECCRPSIERDIAETKPRALFVFGQTAANWVFTKYAPSLMEKNRNAIGNWRGRKARISIGGHALWVYFHQHPATVLRARKEIGGKVRPGPLDDAFKFDLEHAFAEVMAEDFEPPELFNEDDLYEGVEIIDGRKGRKDLERLERLLKQIAKGGHIAFDFETDGLRPYGGARPITAAVSNYKRTVAFALHHREQRWGAHLKAAEKLFTKLILDNPRVTKIAHNLSFDLEFAAYYYGGREMSYRNPWEDSMSQAYILNERRGGTSLDAQTFIHFGFALKDKTPFDAKDTWKMPVEDALWYNSLDAKFTHRLFFLLKEQLVEEELLWTYDFHKQRIKALVHAQMEGAPVNQKTAEKLSGEVHKELQELEEKILKQKDVKKFQRLYGRMQLSSSEQILKFFRDFLKIPEVVEADKADKKTLENVKHPAAKLISRYRSRESMANTFIDPIWAHPGRGGGKNLWSDGKIHTSYKHAWTTTGRLASEDPNMQNYPKRDDKWVRKCIEPFDTRKYVMVAADYGQIEARVFGMASGDEALCKALWENYDIHMDWAQYIAKGYPKRVGGKKMLNDKDAIKAFRTDIKNQWTFPLFFGASLNSASNYLNIPRNVIEPYYEEFWEQFAKVKQWQEELEEFYKENGYVETLTGRRRHAPMTLNEFINSPIQGTASEIVVDAMERLGHKSVDLDMPHLHPILNIHDDLSFILPRKQLNKHLEVIVDSMLNSPFDFINVPLAIEVEQGTNWGEMDEIGKYFTQEWEGKL